MKLNYRNTVVPLMATLTLLAMFLWLMDHLAPTGARANTVRVQFLTASTEAKQTSGKPFSAVNPQGTASSEDRKSTRLNSSHQIISYAVFCLKKKKTFIELSDCT